MVVYEGIRRQNYTSKNLKQWLRESTQLYKYKDRKGIASLFNSKGYPRGKKGQPKINQEILVGLIAKIKMNKKITPYKAWIETTKHKNFTWVLEQHYKNKKGL